MALDPVNAFAFFLSFFFFFLFFLGRVQRDILLFSPQRARPKQEVLT